jgi:hypothetical protein
MYTGNYETLMEEIKEVANKWKNFPWAWFGRFSIIKLFILPKAIDRFCAILIKISIAFLYK